LEKPSSIVRRRIAREAAKLLYTSQEKEYKQAKVRAAEIFGSRTLPSNLEVALELDKLAEDAEGESRKNNLLYLRKTAFQLLRALVKYKPLLVGSVWRGTAHQNSDIDIIVYHLNPKEVLETLHGKGFNVLNMKKRSTVKKGKRKTSFHIYLKLEEGKEAEILVKDVDDLDRQSICEIYGDFVKGLSLLQLREVLEKNPLQKFTPS